jgi:hypothetical protein
MLLSGFYEAFLDNRIISLLIEKQRSGALTIDMRARLLFIILVGNLDLEPETTASDVELVNLSHHSRDNSRQWPNFVGTTARNPNSAWTHIEDLVYPLRSYRDNTIASPRQWPIHDVLCTVPGCTDLRCKETPIPRDAHVRNEIGRTKTRVLHTFLADSLNRKLTLV